MAIYIQFCYMIMTGGPMLQIEKFMLSTYYQGELCNYLVTLDLFFLILFFSYMLAFLMKIINLHIFSFYDVHIQALRNNKGIQDTARKKYFIFYAFHLRESEKLPNYFSLYQPFEIQLINFLYIALLSICLYYSIERHDAQLFNMVCLCSCNLVGELFKLIPPWRRR